MPIRTDAAAVRKIASIDDSFIVEDTDLDPFIEAASSLVDWIVDQQTAGVKPKYKTSVITQIETWLSAHFYHILDPQRIREEVSTVREVFQNQVDLGLDQTRYGQMAKILDTQGWLAGLDNAQKKVTVSLQAKRKVNITWLGKDYVA